LAISGIKVRRRPPLPGIAQSTIDSVSGNYTSANATPESRSNDRHLHAVDSGRVMLPRNSIFGVSGLW
jgi:hypothetical protein